MDTPAEPSALPSAKHSAYAARNALNAGELKRTIEARCVARNDAPDVRRWLANHFFRHVVANFEPATEVPSVTEAGKLSGGALPAWVTARFEANTAPMVWIDPAGPQLLALEARLVEFLTSRAGTTLEGKLERINCPQALALWEQEHARMAERIRRGWRQSRAEALLEVCPTPHGKLVELLPGSPFLREEMAFESYQMGHCLGQFANRKELTGGYGGRYADAAQGGHLRLFSIRDERGEPHVTISVTVDRTGRLAVEQVKGKQNRPPIERYVVDVLAALTALGAGPDELNGDMPDTIGLGLVPVKTGWQRIEEVTDAAPLTNLVARYPWLYTRLTATTPLIEWLVAAREPQLLQQRPPKSAALRYVLRDLLAGRSDAPSATETGGRSPRRRRVAMTEDVIWEGIPETEGLACAPGKVLAMRRGIPRTIWRHMWRLRSIAAVLLLSGTVGFSLTSMAVVIYWVLWKNPFSSLFETDHDGRKLWALALAAPMASGSEDTVFYNRSARKAGRRLHDRLKPQFLHQLGLPGNTDDTTVARFLDESLELTWYRADMSALGGDADPRPALAFATARTAFFLRNALLLGWLAQPLAWRLLLLNAQRAQECFTGWKDFGHAYLTGRKQWILAGRADPMGNFDEAALVCLLERHTKGWSGLPWPGQRAFDPVLAIRRGDGNKDQPIRSTSNRS